MGPPPRWCYFTSCNYKRGQYERVPLREEDLVVLGEVAAIRKYESGKLVCNKHYTVPAGHAVLVSGHLGAGAIIREQFFRPNLRRRNVDSHADILFDNKRSKKSADKKIDKSLNASRFNVEDMNGITDNSMGIIPNTMNVILVDENFDLVSAKQKTEELHRSAGYSFSSFAIIIGLLIVGVLVFLFFKMKRAHSLFATN